MLVFGVRRFLSPKKLSNVLPKQFCAVFFENTAFFFPKKLLIKKIFSLKFLIKKAIFIFGVR